MDKLNISSLGYIVSEGQKVFFQMIEKQTATSKHSCPFCMTSSPNFQKADHYTYNGLLMVQNLEKQKSANVFFILLYQSKQKQKNTRTCKYSWSTDIVRCCRQNLKSD